MGETPSTWLSRINWKIFYLRRRLRNIEILGGLDQGLLQICMFVLGFGGVFLVAISLPFIYASDAEVAPPGTTWALILRWTGGVALAITAVLGLEWLRRVRNDHHSTSPW